MLRWFVAGAAAGAFLGEYLGRNAAARRPPIVTSIKCESSVDKSTRETTEVDDAGPSTGDSSRPPRRSRLKRIAATLSALIVVLIASFALAFGGIYLSSSVPNFYPSIAASIYPSPIAPDSGLYFKMHATVTASYGRCSEVHFALSIEPHDSYFNDSPAWKRYRSGAPAPDVAFSIGFVTAFSDPRNVKITLDDSNLVGTYDRAGRFTAFPGDAEQTSSEAHQFASSKLSVSPKPDEATGSASHTIAYAGKVLDWRAHGMPLQITFDADWNRIRAFGSCYIEMPALLGSSTYSAQAGTAFSLENYLKVPSVPADQRTDYAEARIETASGVLTVDPRSAPPAQADGTEWKCTTEVTHFRNGFTTNPNGDCSGLVIVTASNSDNLRSVATFLAAALFSISLQIAYETVKESVR
jgi:hypothetical protein